MPDRTHIRQTLLKVPLEKRRHWSDADLYCWWDVLRTKEDVRLEPDRLDGTSLDTVKRLFGDLIGKNAPM